MKHCILFIAAGLFLLGTASCQKSYTCTCTYIENGETQTEKYELESSKKEEAQNNCDNKALSLGDKEFVSCGII